MNVSSTEEDIIPWFADFANYLVGKILRKGLTYAQRFKIFSELKHYFSDEPYPFKMFPDGMIRRCVYGVETQKILDECHHGLTGGHYGPSTIAKKVFDASFYWPTIFKEAHTLVQNCDACQHSEAEALPTNDARVVINFLKKLFSRFGIPKALISDRVENTYNEAKLYDLDETGEAIVKGNFLYVKKEPGANQSFADQPGADTSALVPSLSCAPKAHIRKTL
ncbi:reverse transcriptase domain-containing protein [Tanacetum coccineum]